MAVISKEKNVTVSLSKYSGLSDSPQDGLYYSRQDGLWVESPGAAGGETNTLSDQGVGEGTLSGTKVGEALGLKTIKAGANVIVTNGVDEVTIESTGGGSSDHSLLTNRDIADQHPISAITGLSAVESDVALNTSDRHAELHTVVSHSDTTATGANLTELTDGSETTLHTHAGGTATAFELAFDDTDLVANVLTAAHGLGRRPAGISIYDPSDNLVGASVSANATNIIIDFGAPITGTPWNLVAI